MAVRNASQRRNGAVLRKAGPPPPCSAAASNPKRNPSHGLKVLASGGRNPSIDIIALHGLSGHRDATFTATNNVNWLHDADMLPTWIPSARVLTYGYDARRVQAGGKGREYLHEQAEVFLREVGCERGRGGVEKRPVLFVAYCLGGLLLKTALLHAHISPTSPHTSLLLSTYGIIYIGTPHAGGAYSTFSTDLSLLFSSGTDLLQIMKPSAVELHELREGYRVIAGGFETKFAYETHRTTRRRVRGVVIVPKSSAVIADCPGAENLAIHADHEGMVRFKGPREEGFKTLAGHLTLMARKAPGVVGRRWERG